jgi:hypothetical protein
MHQGKLRNSEEAAKRSALVLSTLPKMTSKNHRKTSFSLNSRFANVAAQASLSGLESTIDGQ